MNQPEFLRQHNEPLFPKVLYNRPLRRSGAGRLLVVGGHTGELSLPTGIYQAAMTAGLGECTVVLPDVLAKFIGGAPGTAFAASTTSGSLDRDALGRILELSEDNDAIAFGASLSSNSNTAMLAERLVREAERPLVLFDEALPAIKHNVELVASKPQNVLILTMPEVFKLAGALGIAISIRPGGGLLNKVEIVASIAESIKATLAVYSTEIIVASGAEISVTPINYHLATVPALMYGVLSTFWLQNQARPFEGLTTGAYVIAETGRALPDDTGHNPTLTASLKALEQSLKSGDDW